MLHDEISGYPMLTTFLEDFIRIAPQEFQVELNFAGCITKKRGPNYTTDAAIGLLEVISNIIACSAIGYIYLCTIYT